MGQQADKEAIKASALCAARKMANYWLGLLKIIGGDDVAPIGSGTLVKIGCARGIITAAHVSNAIERESRVGFYQNPFRRTEIQSAAESTTNLAFIQIGKGPYLEVGPDLAFIKIAETKVSLLEMHGAFLNVDRHQQVMTERERTDDHHLDAIVGMVEEWDKSITMRNRAKVIRLDALTNVGHATKIVNAENGFDRLLFRPVPGEDFVLPSSYGGVSGGGLFRAYIDEHGVSRVVFLGVAFWETKTDSNEIICHGPESIYDKLVPMVRQRWR